MRLASEWNTDFREGVNSFTKNGDILKIKERGLEIVLEYVPVKSHTGRSQ